MLDAHPVFSRFDRWSGDVPPGYFSNFVGQLIDTSFFVIWSADGGRRVSPPYPSVDEEIFEWVALLESIIAARERFTMIELGAGFGRWLVAAACAIRRYQPNMKVNLIGVEAEPGHFKFMHKHFTDNGIDPAANTLIEAIVNATGSPAHFIVGHPSNWYGQTVVRPDFVMQDYPDSRVVEVNAITLNHILESWDRIDLLDMDLQGAEAEIISASIEAMTLKVGSTFVATHSTEIHQTLRQSFQRAGWTCAAYHGWTGGIEDTAFGPIEFQDGVQYWINPLLNQDRR